MSEIEETQHVTLIAERAWARGWRDALAKVMVALADYEFATYWDQQFVVNLVRDIYEEVNDGQLGNWTGAGNETKTK
jgi:hypothetical protein